MDWPTLTNDELRELMDEAREEIDRRTQVLAEALNGRPKVGRPKNGTLKLKATDLEPADTDS
jgi:hypothetical protein